MSAPETPAAPRRRFRRPSAALVVASLALVVASSGTTYAAAHYVITSSAQVKDGSLAVADLAPRARAALKGNRGPAGPAGAPGKPASAERVYFAQRGIEMSTSTFTTGSQTQSLTKGNWIATIVAVRGSYANSGANPVAADCGAPNSYGRARFTATASDSYTWVVPITVTNTLEQVPFLSCQMSGSSYISINISAVFQPVGEIKRTPN